MKCADLKRHAEDWLSGAAPPEIEAHLRTCARCRRLAMEIAGTLPLLEALRTDPPEASLTFWARLEEGLREVDRKAEFWSSLALSAQRAALVLGALALALGLWVWTQPAAPVAAFDAPQVFIIEDSSLPGPASNGALDRDQVVLTLVAQREETR